MCSKPGSLLEDSVLCRHAGAKGPASTSRWTRTSHSHLQLWHGSPDGYGMWCSSDVELHRRWGSAVPWCQAKPSPSLLLPHTFVHCFSRYLLKLLSVDCWLDLPTDPSVLCRWPERRLSVSRGYLPSPSEWTLGVSRNSLSFHVPTVPSRAWYLISMEMLVCKTQRRKDYPPRQHREEGRSCNTWKAGRAVALSALTSLPQFPKSLPHQQMKVMLCWWFLLVVHHPCSFPSYPATICTRLLPCLEILNSFSKTRSQHLKPSQVCESSSGCKQPSVPPPS